MFKNTKLLILIVFSNKFSIKMVGLNININNKIACFHILVLYFNLNFLIEIVVPIFINNIEYNILFK